MALIESLIVIGILYLITDDEPKNKSISSNNHKTKPSTNYSKEYCKDNLSVSYYTRHECENIAYELTDNYKKQDVINLTNRGYSFERAIDKMVDEGKIKKG